MRNYIALALIAASASAVQLREAEEAGMVADAQEFDGQMDATLERAPKDNEGEMEGEDKPARKSGEEKSERSAPESGDDKPEGSAPESGDEKSERSAPESGDDKPEEPKADDEAEPIAEELAQEEEGDKPSGDRKRRAPKGEDSDVADLDDSEVEDFVRQAREELGEGELDGEFDGELKERVERVAREEGEDVDFEELEGKLEGEDKEPRGDGDKPEGDKPEGEKPAELVEAQEEATTGDAPAQEDGERKPRG